MQGEATPDFKTCGELWRALSDEEREGYNTGKAAETDDEGREFDEDGEGENDEEEEEEDAGAPARKGKQKASGKGPAKKRRATAKAKRKLSANIHMEEKGSEAG